MCDEIAVLRDLKIFTDSLFDSNNLGLVQQIKQELLEWLKEINIVNQSNAISTESEHFDQFDLATKFWDHDFQELNRKKKGMCNNF